MTCAADQLSFDLAMESDRAAVPRTRRKHRKRNDLQQLSFRLAPLTSAKTARQVRGSVSYRSGRAAEDQVARTYMRRGAELVAERWRGKGGEIDLILRDPSGLIFVEVKRSRTHDAAIRRVTARQVARLYAAAEEYAGSAHPGQLIDMRFDVATVDAQGSITIRSNAFA